MTVYTFRAVWPIVDDSLTVAELIAEGEDLLPAVAARAHVELVGAPKWDTAEGESLAGYAAYDLILIAEVPAVEAPRRDVGPSEQVDVVRRLALDGWSDGRIAEAMGCSKGAVLNVRHANRIAPAKPSPRPSGYRYEAAA